MQKQPAFHVLILRNHKRHRVNASFLYKSYLEAEISVSLVQSVYACDLVWTTAH